MPDSVLKSVICGGGEREAWMHARAYRGQDYAVLHGVCGAQAAPRAAAWGCRAYGGFDEVLADAEVGIVELLDDGPDRADLVAAAVGARKHVLLSAPLASDMEQAARIAKLANNTRQLVMPYENWFFFPPMQKVLSLSRKKVVGRVTSVRMRSLIAGAGGWDPYLNPDFRAAEPTDAQPPQREASKTIFREICEKLSIALRLLGPIEEIHCLTRSGGAAGVNTAVVTWKYRAHASYGALDITLAPDMTIRSPYAPRDDNMEITGGSGIIWLARAASQLRNEPAVHVYRGENHFAYGHLQDDFLLGYSGCVRHFGECVKRGEKPELSIADTVRALEAACAAAKSAHSGERLRI